MVERHPNDKAEPRRHNHHVHELRAVLASVSTVPRKVMYFDRMALFLNVDAHIPIDGHHHTGAQNHPIAAAYLTLFKPTAYGWYRRCFWLP